MECTSQPVAANPVGESEIPCMLQPGGKMCMWCDQHYDKQHSYRILTALVRASGVATPRHTWACPHVEYTWFRRTYVWDVYKHSHVLITTGCGRWCQCETRVTHALRSCGWLISAAYVNTHMHIPLYHSYCSWQEWEKLHAGGGARFLSELLVHTHVSLAWFSITVLYMYYQPTNLRIKYWVPFSPSLI